MTSDLKAKPCRWCGQAPGIEEEDEDGNASIMCANGNCTVLPCINATGLDYAIVMWNQGAGV